jgi:hypothetical protein
MCVAKEMLLKLYATEKEQSAMEIVRKRWRSQLIVKQESGASTQLQRFIIFILFSDAGNEVSLQDVSG